MADITWDASSLEAGIGGFTQSVQAKVKKGVSDIANEVLRLSQIEVPHLTGQLMSSGEVDPGADDNEKIVGYNKVYAAYQHEGHRADGSHQIQHYGEGRKGKYLEDPIRLNLDTFKKYFNDIFK